MYCNKCGKTIPDGSRYCSFCGAEQGKGKSPMKSIMLTALAAVIMYGVGSAFGTAVAEPKLSSTPSRQDSPSVIQEAPTAAQEQPAEAYYGVIASNWAAENRYLEDGGTCGIMQMDKLVENCTSVDFTLSAEGNYGATTAGNWEIHFRTGGQWKHVQTVYYGGTEEETFHIQFSSATTFDAVSAFPTQRGNYSYSALYYLSNPSFV